MPKLQHAVVAVLAQVLDGVASVQQEVCPDWLRRPGRVECGGQWDLVAGVYGELTGLVLPTVMPPRERRRIDAVLTYTDGRQRVLEVDESQHFTFPRLTTLAVYPARVSVAFDVMVWRKRCEVLAARAPRGGFARSCPPLFTGEGGRHHQRAFRDFLADVLPLEHGWLPTMRMDDKEAEDVLAAPSPARRLKILLDAKETCTAHESKRS